MELTQLLKDNDLSAYYAKRNLRLYPKPKFEVKRIAFDDDYSCKFIFGIISNIISIALIISSFAAKAPEILVLSVLFFIVSNLLISWFCEAGMLRISWLEYKKLSKLYEDNNKPLDYSNLDDLSTLYKYICEDAEELKNTIYNQIYHEKQVLFNSIGEIESQIHRCKNQQVKDSLSKTLEKLNSRKRVLNSNEGSSLKLEKEIKDRYSFLTDLSSLIKANDLISTFDSLDDIEETIELILSTNTHNSFEELVEIYGS
jgi:hypothetical protein